MIDACAVRQRDAAAAEVPCMRDDAPSLAVIEIDLSQQVRAQTAWRGRMSRHKVISNGGVMRRVIMVVAGAAVAALVASPAFAQRQGVGENAPQINTRVHA